MFNFILNDEVIADHLNDGLSASGSAQARSESVDVATSLSVVREQVQEVSSVVLVASEEAEVDPGVDQMEAGMAVVLFGIFQCRRGMLRVKGR